MLHTLRNVVPRAGGRVAVPTAHRPIVQAFRMRSSARPRQLGPTPSAAAAAAAAVAATCAATLAAWSWSTCERDVALSMEELIGPMPDVVCTTGVVKVRGLGVKWWRYEHKDTPADAVPVVALHGGPAFTHNYILPLKLLANGKTHPVIFYDQVCVCVCYCNVYARAWLNTSLRSCASGGLWRFGSGVGSGGNRSVAADDSVLRRR